MAGVGEVVDRLPVAPVDHDDERVWAFACRQAKIPELELRVAVGEPHVRIVRRLGGQNGSAVTGHRVPPTSSPLLQCKRLDVHVQEMVPAFADGAGQEGPQLRGSLGGRALLVDRLIDAFEVLRHKLPEVGTGVRQLVQVEVLGETSALCDDQAVRVALDCRR